MNITTTPIRLDFPKAPEWVVDRVANLPEDLRAQEINLLESMGRINLAEAEALHGFFLTDWNESTRWGA